MAARVTISKHDPTGIEVYEVRGIEDESSHQKEGVVLRWRATDGGQSFQCVSCHTENACYFSPCAHIEELKRQLGIRITLEGYSNPRFVVTELTP